MGGQTLLPATEIKRASSEGLKRIRAPHLKGWLLTLAVWILETWLGSLVLNRMWRRSGIQQVLREVELPEEPTYEPVWPHPVSDSAGINIEEVDPPTRAMVAAHTIPGFSVIRDAGDGGPRVRRWEIADYAQAYRSHLVSPVDVAESILDGLRLSEAAEPAMRFLVAQDPDDLLQQAKHSAERHKQGESLSPLDGVPYAVIDAIDALPYPTTAGTSYLAAERPVVEDAPCVSALRRAGAMLVGKATLHELGIGMTGVNTRTGSARNPYNPGFCAGGSASGSAAIVSAGICAFALGIDGGGSVRVPAALCGVVGFKPTAGRTSHRGCPPSAFSVMSFGPMAVSVADAMLVNAVISNAGTAGRLHPPGPTTVVRSLFDDTPNSSGDSKPLRGTKAGVFSAWMQTAAPEVLSTCNRTLRSMAQLGCEVVAVEIPELELVRAAQMVAIGCEIAQACKPAYLDAHKRRQMNLETRITLASTTRFLATDFLQAQKIRTRLMTHFQRVFEEVDCIACPTVGRTAPPLSESAVEHGESDMTLTAELMNFTIPVNMSGIPAISIPIDRDSKGLPIGLQLMGKPWHEAELFRIASAVESCTTVRTELPQISFDVLFGSP